MNIWPERTLMLDGSDRDRELNDEVIQRIIETVRDATLGMCLDGPVMMDSWNAVQQIGVFKIGSSILNPMETVGVRVTYERGGPRIRLEVGAAYWPMQGGEEVIPMQDIGAKLEEIIVLLCGIDELPVMRPPNPPSIIDRHNLLER